MSTAQFIVIEGIDGAGTTTHSARLAKSLKRTRRVHATREPSDGPIGVLLRQILTGRVVVPHPFGPRTPSWQTMGLLFGADRMDHLDAEIRPALAQGFTVVSDRYDYSTVAYQSVSTGGVNASSIAWLREINVFADRPDLTLVLDVPAEVARERRLARAGGGEIYDDDALQRELGMFYREIEQHFPGENIVHVDANRPMEEVAADIMQHVEALWAP